MRYGHHVTYSSGDGSASTLSFLVKMMSNKDYLDPGALPAMDKAKNTVKTWIGSSSNIPGATELVIMMRSSHLETWSLMKHACVFYDG